MDEGKHIKAVIEFGINHMPYLLRVFIIVDTSHQDEHRTSLSIQNCERQCWKLSITALIGLFLVPPIAGYEHHRSRKLYMNHHNRYLYRNLAAMHKRSGPPISSALYHPL